MLKGVSLLAGLLGLSLLAVLPSSTTYKLNSYGIGPGGTNGSSSTTYKTQGNLGEVGNGSTSGTTYSAKSGAVKAEQLNVPPAPTLGNGSGTYYNKLSVVVNTANNPADTTYAIAASTNNFVSTLYVQADGTLSATAVYQTYTAWGGAGGTFMTGLASSTTYQVKVDAKQGLYTDTGYGTAASFATVATSLSFSVSPNTTTLANLLPGSVVTSSDLTFGLTTNAASGGGVYLSGQNNGLLSARVGHTISAFGGDISTVSEGFGVQIAGVSQTSGGPLAAVSPYNGSGTTVGAETLAPKVMLSTSAPIVGGSSTAKLKAKASTGTPASADYQEVLTFVAAAGF